MKNETIETIMQWHKETFPDATLEGQVDKFVDEQVECTNAKNADEKIDELADMFIVACGIGRFSQQDFICDISLIKELMDQHNISCVRLEAAVNKKMEVNRQRKWGKRDGKYQHIED